MSDDAGAMLSGTSDGGRRRIGPSAARAVLVSVVALTLSGCGGAVPQDGARVGESFNSAVRASAWSRACDHLAPETRAELEQSAGTSCSAALADEHPSDPGPLEGSSTFGTMTQLRFQQDTMFLARFESGWKVMALECSPVSGHPYDCRLQGG